MHSLSLTAFNWSFLGLPWFLSPCFTGWLYKVFDSKQSFFFFFFLFIFLLKFCSLFFFLLLLLALFLRVVPQKYFVFFTRTIHWNLTTACCGCLCGALLWLLVIWSCCSGSLWTVILWWEVWTTRTLNWPLEMAAIPDWWIRGPSVRNKNKKNKGIKMFSKWMLAHLFFCLWVFLPLWCQCTTWNLKKKKKKSVQTN